MKLSTKGRYGVRALADLAIHSNGSPVSLLSIATRQNISASYLEGMFAALKRAGLVVSVRGVGGGYLPARGAADTSIGDILRVLVGDLSIVDPEDAFGLRLFLKKNVWDDVSRRINAIVNTMTLQDLIDGK